MKEIKVESGQELPPGRRWLHGKLHQLREALSNMSQGESFLWEDNKAPYDAAKQLRIKIATRKQNGDGYRVWRVK